MKLKNKILALLPIIIFSLASPFISKTGIARSSCILILSLGFPLAILSSYILFGKKGIKSAFLGALLSSLLMTGSMFLIYLVRTGEFFVSDVSIYSLASIAAVALLAAVGEEFVFRGALLGLLVRYFERVPLLLLLVVQALVFTASHPAKSHSIMFFVVTFFSGIFLGWAVCKTKSLWFSIGFHFGWDFTIVLFTGFHSMNFGHIKSLIIFGANYPSVNDFVFLLAVCLGALIFKKSLRE